MSPKQAHKLGTAMIVGLSLCVAIAMVIFGLIALTVGLLMHNPVAIKIGTWFLILTPLTAIPCTIRRLFFPTPK